MAKYIIVHGIKVAQNFVPETFGRLTTIGPRFMLPVGTQGEKASHQVCLCNCGSEFRVVLVASLVSGKSQSCGCVQKQKLVARNQSNARHGMTGTPEHKTWAGMIKRCEDKGNASYGNYGARNVKVCPEWRDPLTGFMQFYSDMGPKPALDYEIERKDVNGNYCPENCCWIPPHEQKYNTRRSHMLTYQGKTQCIALWERDSGLSQNTIHRRIIAGWPVEKILSTPARKRHGFPKNSS